MTTGLCRESTSETSLKTVAVAVAVHAITLTLEGR